ncbi:hypothetical protein N2605_25950 [Bradyrhizobium yuanmingense]|uniref:hypothetical protein n=1 Tax=Bradyrhizobium yuanmingense TaxID=108015 RepID=UPI0021A4DD94|nr:hypothetical protein [Bradyrhizobium sp. CB1024]UWU83000.1 hypothetical protein N2605_25950 [Bradyrhizobium sp. CB1024]
MSGQSSPPPLIILQVTLTFWEASPQIELLLIRGVGKPGSTESWQIPARELGVPGSIETDAALDLNLWPQITGGIKNSLKGDAKDLPLWLRFAKPHGYVSVLPWERVLTETLERPVLRFPDLLERPCEDRDVLELAIWFDPDRSASLTNVQTLLNQIVEAILSTSPRAQSRVHLFTASFWHRLLERNGYDKRLKIHDPVSAPTSAAVFSQGSIEPPFQSLWWVWMKAALGMRSLDAIFFVCNSGMTEFGPALRMSNSIAPNEKYESYSYIDAMDLAAIVTRAGAWAALFSNPPSGAARPTLALAADALAHTRPTAVLYQPLGSSQQIASLRGACSFLFAPNSAPAPSMVDGFLYCPPNYVDAYESLRISSPLPALNANASIFHSASIADRTSPLVSSDTHGIPDYEMKQAPSWATSLQRQCEFSALERLRRNASDVLLSSSDSARTQVTPDESVEPIAGSDDTLEQIHKVVGNYFRKLGG